MVGVKDRPLTGQPRARGRTASLSPEYTHSRRRDAPQIGGGVGPSVPVGVVLTGLHGRYVGANQAFQRMTGYSEAELRNLSPVDITHEDERVATETIIAARAAGYPYPQHVEKRFRRKDGGVTWVDASAFVIPVVDGVPLSAGIVVDVTERKPVVEQEPLARNRIALSSDRADVFGSPLATIDWRVGEKAAQHSIALTKHFLQFWANSVLAPLARFEIEPTPKIIDGLKSGGSIYHPGGSTRMGRSSSEAVVDENLRTFAIPNLNVLATSVSEEARIRP